MARTEIYEFTVGSTRSQSTFSGPRLKNRLENFAQYFQAQVDNVLSRLSIVGRNASRKALQSATTPWGFARMDGNYGGVRFRPYGRSAGREDTGFMFESLIGGLEDAPSLFGTSRQVRATDKQAFFGWSRETISSNPYIAAQENGFYSNGAFDPAATERDGVARFKAGARKYIEGADSLSFGAEKVAQVAESFFSGAWNEAVRQWNADGFSGSVGSYLDNRVAPLKFKQTALRRRRSRGRDEF